MIACAKTQPSTGQAPTEIKDTRSFKTKLVLAPVTLGGKEVAMRMQSFEGDVCISDGRGGGFVSHCRCEGNDCTCQGATASCVP